MPPGDRFLHRLLRISQCVRSNSKLVVSRKGILKGSLLKGKEQTHARHTTELIQLSYNLEDRGIEFSTTDLDGLGDGSFMFVGEVLRCICIL
jgi:hypothetical protein